jgi:hypothetical protein
MWKLGFIIGLTSETYLRTRKNFDDTGDISIGARESIRGCQDFKDKFLRTDGGIHSDFEERAQCLGQGKQVKFSG